MKGRQPTAKEKRHMEKVRNIAEKDGGGFTVTVEQDGQPQTFEYEMVMESNDNMTVLGEISYRPVEGGTEVSWHDRGDLGWNPLLRLLKPVFERTMGGAFEQGLEGLASRVEAAQR